MKNESGTEKHGDPVQREYKRETQWSSLKRIEERNTKVQCKENRREKHKVSVQRESKREKHGGPVQRKSERETQWSCSKRIEEGETQRSMHREHNAHHIYVLLPI